MLEVISPALFVLPAGLQRSWFQIVSRQIQSIIGS
jgi:hypothetical protein